MAAECAVPVNQYFWLNSLHPTYPMHDVVAEGVSKAQEPDLLSGTLARDALVLCHRECESVKAGKAVRV